MDTSDTTTPVWHTERITCQGHDFLRIKSDHPLLEAFIDCSIPHDVLVQLRERAEKRVAEIEARKAERKHS